MFRFEHPEFFWTAVVTGMIVMFYYYRQRIRPQDWLKWSSKSSYQRISSQFNDLSFGWLLMLAAVFLSFAAVNPQWGYKTENVDAKTADIYILLDISNSMLAEDVAPSRLEKARRFALDLSDAFKSDRIGLVSFAGNAYIQSPLTTDWHAIQLYLSSANPS
ncbi:MAG TPA: VWA domain-containing protein, partial [Flavobacterium sp.]|nr:VWA domain-containing protein [Flavobacterium sp.]